MKKKSLNEIYSKDNLDFLKDIKLPLKYDGAITDADGNVLILANREAGSTPLNPYQRDQLLKYVTNILNIGLEELKLGKREITFESASTKYLNENAQIGDTVMFDKQKGYIIGQTGDGDFIIQIQGSTHKAKPNKVKVIGAKAKATTKPPFKFDSKTQKVLFEQWVKCGIYMNTIPVKMNDCYVMYSNWQKAKDNEPINIMVEGQTNMLPKNQIRILENVDSFANLDNYVEGVIIDEGTGEAIENVHLNVVDYTEALGDAEPVRIIRGYNTSNPETDTIPKALLKTLSV